MGKVGPYEIKGKRKGGMAKEENRERRKMVNGRGREGLRR